MLEGLPDIVQLLADAPPHDKGRLYEAFGLQLTYHPDRRTVVTADPTGEAGVRKVRRRGDSTTMPTKAHHITCAVKQRRSEPE